MRVREKTVAIQRRFVTLVVVLCMMCMAVMPVMAASDANVLTATEDPRDSVMQIALGYEDDLGNFNDFQWGTCFLINDEYVLTNKHVITMTDEDFELFKEVNQVPNLAPNDSHIKLYLYVNRDMRVGARMHESVNSDDMDFAAVKLAEKIYDRKPIALGDSSKIQPRQTVYAMGYPADSISNKEYNTRDDVSTVDGTISKVTVSGSGNSSVDIIEHTAGLNHGNSGGPLLDEDDNVIGLNTFIYGKKNYSVQINAIKRGLDTFGIPYVEGGAVAPSVPDPEPTPEEDKKDNSAILNSLQDVLQEAREIDGAGYTQESIEKLNDCIAAAESVVTRGDSATESEIMSATDDLNDAIMNLEEKSGVNVMLIAGIAAAAVIVIVIIVVVVVSGNKKKTKATSVYSERQGGDPAPDATLYQEERKQQPSMEGAGETTLLNAGAGETTLLGGAGASAYLLRKKNGEKISVNLQNFKIGKERRRVNYCIGDNTTVSRLHCEIVRRGADYYVEDLGSANGTYVNGIQVSPHKETLLSDRSVLKLSDEEFEFHLS